MMRLSKLSISLTLIAIGFIFIFAGNASAQTVEPVRAINLSPSGFEQAHSLSFSSNGDYLAIGGTSGVYLYDSQKLSAIDFIQSNVWARSVAFLPNTNTLAAGLFDNTIKFWDVPGKQLIKTLDESQGRVRSVSFSKDGFLIASASDDNTIRIWQVESGKLILSLNKNTNGVRAVALSPDGILVAGALQDNTVRIWNVSNGKLLYTLSGHQDWVRCLAFSPDGQLLASGSFDKNILIWNMLDGKLIRTLKGHSASVLGVAFSPDGKTIASGSVDETVRLWNASDGSPIRVLQGHVNFVYAVAFSPDGKTLASGGGDNTVRLWDLEAVEKNTTTEFPNITTPSDCRACHHRRGQVEPARVIELSCENCHAGGIGLSWCTGFPRSSLIESTPIHFTNVEDIAGVPVNSDDIAVVIASPGNGETLYVRGNFMAPEFISGKVFYSDPQSISKVEVHLDIISGGETSASLVTYPTENGAFNFNVAINSQSPPPHLSRPGTRQCLLCHGDFSPEASLPKGDVQIVVTAITPDGQQATDNRWFHVDPSEEASIPVHVINDETQKPLGGLTIEASTILYQWRDRFGDARSDADGEALLTLEKLSQAQTTYAVSIPPQVVNGILYASTAPTELILDQNSLPTPLTLTAHALKGQINGEFGVRSSSSSLKGTTIWAIQLPAGPAYQTSLTDQNMFVFKDIPISQYLVIADTQALAKQNFYTTSHTTDLFNSPLANMSFSLDTGRPIYGKVIAKDNSDLPFAWVDTGKVDSILAIDPTSSEFLIPNFPPDTFYVTVSAPGYYSLPKSVTSSTEKLEFQLVPRPETRFLTWGNGQIVLPPETKATVDQLAFNLEYGWLWGQSTSPQPVQIHLPNADISLSNGKFALEKPTEGIGWFYLYQGQAKVIYHNDQPPVQVGSGQMIALVDGANPFPIESTIATALHPDLKEAPVSEIMEPSVKAQIQNWLVKTGIGAMQTITFITYILSLVTLITIPLIVLFSYRRKSQKSLDSQEIR